MKKLIAFILAVSIMIVNAASASAAVAYDYEDTSVNVLTPVSFAQLFSTNTVSRARYSYSYAAINGTSHRMTASVALEIAINGRLYFTNLSGTLDKQTLSSGVIMWQGPLEGNITISGTSHSIIASFTKLNNSDDVQISITIHNDPLPPVVFFFGDLQIPNDAVAAFTNNSNSNSYSVQSYTADPGNEEITFGGEDDTFESLGANGEWNYITNDVAFYGGNNGYNAVFQSVLYVDPDTNRLMVMFRTDSGQMHDLLEYIGYSLGTSYVYKIRADISVNSTNNTNYAGCDYVELWDYTNCNNILFPSALAPLFEDALGLLGVPTSTISALLNNATGFVKAEDGGANSYCEVTFGWFSNKQFDSLENGMPLMFHFETSDSYNGNTPCTVTSSLTYLTMGFFNNTTPVFFLNTLTTEMDVVITF